MVYRKIAKLHAASYMLGKSEDHKCVTKFQDGMFCTTAITEMDFMTQGIVSFVNALKKHKEFVKYLEKIEIMKSEMKQKCEELYKAYKLKNCNNEIMVLNHGDFHLRNMMFKLNNEQKIEDLIMVDYQLSCYAPSTIDLTYSQYLIMAPEMRLRRNEFMHYYFEEFLRVLKKLKFEGEMPRYSDFQIAALKYRHFGKFLAKNFL